MTKKKIYVDDIIIKESGEFGRTVTWACPECGEKLEYYQYMSDWNKNECKCGYDWDHEIRAIGTK